MFRRRDVCVLRRRFGRRGRLPPPSRAEPRREPVAYVRGSKFWWRRGYEGSGRYRLWLHGAGTDSLLNLSELGPADEPGMNTRPAWFPDGDHALYPTEIGGVSNLRILSVADGGSRIVELGLEQAGERSR